PAATSPLASRIAFPGSKREPREWPSATPLLPPGVSGARAVRVHDPVEHDACRVVSPIGAAFRTAFSRKLHAPRAPPFAVARPGWTAAGCLAPGLAVGDPAPAFSYLGVDGRWHRSRDLTARGAMLLVFGARESQLLDLEAARSAFGALGVQTVVVLDMRTGS